MHLSVVNSCRIDHLVDSCQAVQTRLVECRMHKIKEYNDTRSLFMCYNY